MSIGFSQIPRDQRLPGSYTEIDSSQAVRGLPGMPHKVLCIGQQFANAEVPPLTPYLVTDPDQAALASGRGSMVHAECAAFRKLNDRTEMWAIGLEDAASGIKSVQSVTFSKANAGVDFGAGVANLRVGLRRVRIAVSATMTVAEIVAGLIAAANDPMLPAVLSEGATPETLLVTAKHAGATAGEIDVRLNFFADETTPVNLRAVVAEVTAGAGNPEIDAALAMVEGDWWTGIVCPYLDGENYAALLEFLTDRFDALDQRDGKAYSARNGSVTDLFNWGENVNGEFVTVLPLHGCPVPPWEVAARYAAIGEFQFAIDPARQLKTLSLGIPAPAPQDRPTDAEQELLLHSGISAVDYTGGELRLWRCITNYQVSDAGAEDTAYLDLTTIALIAFLRWSENNRMELRFPRHKLANDGTRVGPGQPVATPQIISGELIALYREWETAGLVEDTAGFIERLVVQRPGGDPNRINSLQTPDLINNLRVIAALMQFRL